MGFRSPLIAVVTLALAVVPSATQAYDNKQAHPALNGAIVGLF